MGFVDNYGYGIICGDHSSPLIYNNTIQNNRYDGIYLVDYSNATITNNTIDNNDNAGIYIRGIVYSISGTTPIYTVCHTRIENNTITNNYNWGIANLISPMEAFNNTISHTRNGSGIWIQSNYFISGTGEPVGISTPGDIANNTIQYNDQYGINLSSIESTRYRGVIIMDLYNNTITNNNWSGINVMGGRYAGSQSSPNPDIYLNNLSYNNHSGVRNYETRNYDFLQNTVEWNNASGILCEVSSRPRIIDNNKKKIN